MKVYCYNEVVVTISCNLIHYHRTKHVELDHHFIKENIKNDEHLCCVHTFITTNDKNTGKHEYIGI